MKSPFPGMDPYIEACGLWEDFHNHLIEAIYRDIAKALPRRYFINTATRSYVVVAESEGKDEKPAKPDVTITEVPSRTRSGKKGGVAVAEPAASDESIPMQAFIAEEFKENFIEIYAQLEERVLVTCIEVLSPANKRRKTKGWRVYQRKRQAMLLGRANFIEIDLVRQGSKMPMLNPWPDSPYTLLVSRAERAPKCRVWPAHFTKRLPPIPVPLFDPDPDLTLDLQPLIDEISAIARYDDLLDYNRKLTPPLPKEDASKLRALLKARR